MAQKNTTNSGKKETRQFDQLVDKATKEGKLEQDGAPREVEARTAPRQHSQKGNGGK